MESHLLVKDVKKESMSLNQERGQLSFIREQGDEEVWNEVAKNMRP